ncbi:MAG: ABC transporter permease [Armatimonadota bacterium]
MSTTSAEKKIEVGRLIKLPLSKAFSISLNSIRIRFWRSMITAGGTFLGIAFLVSVLTQSMIDVHLPGTLDKAAAEAARNRQIWLVMLSLIVCAVGITNSMLMSVTERFREIGTMKCLGALDKFIVELFLLESGVLGIIASFAGWLVGFASVWLMGLANHGWNVVGQITFIQILSTLGLGIVIGVFLTVVATIPPAMRASKMPPAMAMRADF